MLAAIANTFSNCFKIPELKSRILFTLMVLAICRLTALVHIPGLDGAALTAFFEDANKKSGGGVLGMYSMFTGGALERCAIGSLGIMPYISATIMLQLLTAVIPTLSKLAREEGGRTKLIQYGRYLTVPLCLGWGIATTLSWENPSTVFQGFTGKLVLYDNLWWYRIQTVLILTTGTLLLMWLGEQITERGIGNGVSLVITIGILARLPQAAESLKIMFIPGPTDLAKFNIGHAVGLIALLFFVIGCVIAITQAQRKIPVQYAQRMVGRKVYAGTTSYMPLRVNFSGVMPIIFAQAILMFPQRFFLLVGNWLHPPGGAGRGPGADVIADACKWIANKLIEGGPWYLILYSLMILFFSYFWVATQFNELQIADDLKKNGGYIPGVRPGQATSEYLHNAMSRITLAGAVFLVVIATIPIIMSKNVTPPIPYTVSTFFGGTSMLITVGVLLDTMRQMETHLLMRHYDGFLKKGKLRGRF
jgi:preprotein translocase subunit SecY